MAFTTDELSHGGLLTWLLFSGLVPCGFLAGAVPSLPYSEGFLSVAGIAALVLLAAAMFGVIIAIIGLFLMPLGLVLAWPIARLLRRVRAMPAHIAAYTLLGGAIGWLYLRVTGFIDALSTLYPFTILMLTPAVAITIATPLGWWLTASRALRKDAESPPTPAEPDAAAEDATTP